EGVPAADDQQRVDPVLLQAAADAVQVLDGRDVAADAQLGPAEAAPALDVTPLQLAHVPVDQALEAALDPEHGVATVQAEANRRPSDGVHARSEPAHVDQ